MKFGAPKSPWNQQRALHAYHGPVALLVSPITRQAEGGDAYDP